MLRLTKKAEFAMNTELSNYEAFLKNRATVYANQDDSIEIKDRHIIKAIMDYRNDYYYVSREKTNVKERRNYHYLMFLFATICLVLYVLIILLFLEGETLSNTIEVISLLGAITTLALVMIMYASIIRKRKIVKENEHQSRIVVFLNKWNEFESLLRALYKKKNKKDPKTFRELLVFYQQQPSVIASGKDDSLHRLLNSRNNLLHRNIKEVNVETIDGLIEEMDAIIENLKTIE